MTFTFKPATLENVGLLIGLAGPSGSGKTFSAMELAAGLAGDKKWCVIDTESGRAKHYAKRFSFDHGSLRAPFRPSAYEEAIMAADAAGYAVIVVDSASHEHEGEGGILEMHEDELDRMAGDNYQKREACKMAAWIKPKTEHKHFVQKLLQLRAHLILCFRAEEKIEIVRENNKTVIKPKQSITGADGYIPICEKRLPYELTLSILLKPDRPGFPCPIKLQEQHKPMLPLDQPITRATGAALAAWAAGDETGSSARDDLAPLLKAIAVAEKEEHVTSLKPRIAKLAGAEREDAIQAATQRLEELKREKQLDAMEAPKTVAE